MDRNQIIDILKKYSIKQQTNSLLTQYSLNYVTSEDIYSHVDVPRVDMSMRDGYAVCFGDSESVFKVVGEIRAGNNLEWFLNPGQAVYITTGAIVPVNCDAIVMIEYCLLNDGILTVSEKLSKDQWIRKIGSDVKKNSVIIEKNTKIKHSHIGLLVTTGIKKVEVYKNLNIGVLSTGNEVVDLCSSGLLDESKIYDSNKPMISSFLNEESFFVRDLGILKDDPETMFSSISKILRESDIQVLITSGGVSMGDKDFVKEVLHKIGAVIHVEKTNLKPGKPMVVSTFRNKIIFSLAGNPVSSLTAMVLFVLPFLKNDYSLNTFIATTTSTIQPDKSRVEYLRGILEYSKETNQFYVRKSDSNQSSSNIKSIANSNCFITVHPGPLAIAKGAKVEVILNGQIKEYKRILQIGVLTMSDRASSGVYDDKSGNEIIKFMEENIDCEYQINYKLIPDEKHLIESELINLVDSVHCNFIITTGGTGPSKRDNTVEITQNVCHKMLPGFGEVMRLKNFDAVPTTILSSQTAGLRYINDNVSCIIINLPGSPKSIRECLDIVIKSFPICSKIIGSPLVTLKEK